MNHTISTAERVSNFSVQSQIHDTDIDRARAEDIVDVVESYGVELKLRGKEFTGLCSFHDDHHPSFSVNREKGQYLCRSCDAKGDTIGFVMARENVSFPDAVRKIIGRSQGGSSLPPMTEEQRRKRAERMEQQRREREAEEQARYAEAAVKARAAFDAAIPANDDHPYLQRKRVKAHGLRIGTWEFTDQDTGEVRTVKNTLLVPVFRKVDGKGTISSLEGILPDGSKYGFEGGQKRDGYHVIGRPKVVDGRETFVIAEGYSTAAAIHEATGHCVVMTFTAGNLLSVAKQIRAGKQDAEIVIFSDRDAQAVENSGGTRKAVEAALAINAQVVVPEWTGKKGRDANDIWVDGFTWGGMTYPGKDILEGCVKFATPCRSPAFMALMRECGIGGQDLASVQADTAANTNSDASARALGGGADAAEPLSPERAIVAELNEQHAVVLAGDKAVVLRECPSDTPGHGIEVRLLAAAAFKLFYLNRTLDIMVMNAEGESRRRTVQIADWWLKSAERRTYEGITFAPGGDAPANYYNLWHGYAVEPRQASLFSNALKCRRLLRHIKLNVCRGNREHFRYLLAWAADMVQDPSRKKGVALVLRGNKGSGKSKVAEVFASLLGQHAIKIAQMKHLVGNFNLHLANKLLVVAEESFWAGGKADDGPLKDMITSPTITLEAKGIDAIEMRSFARIMMITNNSWAVPATSDERRYFVLDVGNDKREDHAYFAAIDEQMDGNGQEGRRALLAFLLAFDLSKVNLRKVLETSALREQRSLSLEPHDQFIFDALLDKRIAGRDWDWEIEVPKDELHSAYIDAGKKRGKSHLLPNSELAKKLKRFNIISTKLRDGGRRVPSYRFPEWEACVSRFEELMGVDVDVNSSTLAVADEPF